MGASTTNEQAAMIEATIRGISHIATLPEITLKIIELVEDPTSTAQDLHNIIASDQALCSRILKVVNSAFYGLPRQIGSINRAIVLLGLNAVKNIAIAASLTKLFRGGELCPEFSARDLWIHSVATAACAKLICDQMKLEMPDEAFLTGLIHDIGIMVEMQGRRDDLVEVFGAMNFDKNGVPDCDMREVERRVMGADHSAFGAALCESWKFPKPFVFATGHHHDPLALPAENRMLTSIICVADRMSAQLGYGFRSDLLSTEIDDDILGEVRMTGEQLETVREKLPQAYDEVEATFS